MHGLLVINGCLTRFKESMALTWQIELDEEYIIQADTCHRNLPP